MPSARERVLSYEAKRGAFGSWQDEISRITKSEVIVVQDGPGSSCKWGELTIINGFALG